MTESKGPTWDDIKELRKTDIEIKNLLAGNQLDVDSRKNSVIGMIEQNTRRIEQLERQSPISTNKKLVSLAIKVAQIAVAVIVFIIALVTKLSGAI